MRDKTEQEWLAWANENLPPERVKQYLSLRASATALAKQHRWRLERTVTKPRG